MNYSVKQFHYSQLEFYNKADFPLKGEINKMISMNEILKQVYRH